jgi:hypothetical protein
VNHEIAIKNKKGLRRKDYSQMVRFFGGMMFSSTGCFPLSAMALGVFLWRRRTRGREVMEVYVNGFAEHKGGYFISCESASGVITGWRALMGIPNSGGFFPNAKGSSIEQCSWLPNKDFLRILRQGAGVCVYSARVKVPECVQKSEGPYAQIKGNHHKTNAKIKFHIYCRNSNIPSTN